MDNLIFKPGLIVFPTAMISSTPLPHCTVPYVQRDYVRMKLLKKKIEEINI